MMFIRPQQLCSEIRDIAPNLQCKFATNTPTCHEDMQFVDYINFIYCMWSTSDVVFAGKVFILVSICGEGREGRSGHYKSAVLAGQCITNRSNRTDAHVRLHLSVARHHGGLIVSDIFQWYIHTLCKCFSITDGKH